MNYNHITLKGDNSEFMSKVFKIRKRAQLTALIALAILCAAIFTLIHIVIGDMTVLSCFVTFIVDINICLFLGTSVLEYIYSRTARRPAVMKWAVYNNMTYLSIKYGECSMSVDVNGLFSITNKGGKYSFPQITVVKDGDLTGDEKLVYDVNSLTMYVVKEYEDEMKS